MAMPSECLALIEEFAPWSDELLDDMLHTLKDAGGCVYVQRFNPPYLSAPRTQNSKREFRNANFETRNAFKTHPLKTHSKQSQNTPKTHSKRTPKTHCSNCSLNQYKKKQPKCRQRSEEELSEDCRQKSANRVETRTPVEPN